MKIAFCISGLFKPSTTHSAAYENKFAYLTEKIKEYKADTFIYSLKKSNLKLLTSLNQKILSSKYRKNLKIK